MLSPANDRYRREFHLYIEEISKELEIAVEQVWRKTAFDLLDGIASKTPVDTGLARASWFVELDRPSNQVGNDPTRDPISPGLQTINSAKLGNSINITNNLPYIVPLEFGHSQDQAPSGMVSVTLAELESVGKDLLG